MNDPLGDMLTRIRNAQERRRPKVSSPASNLRARVLDVLVDEGYIRGYARVDHKNGLSEFEIELKYANGQPAIREIKRVSKPGRRVYKAVRDLANVANGLGVAILSTPKGVMSDSACARGERRRRDPLQRVLRRVVRTAKSRGSSDVAHRQETGRDPVGRDGDGGRPEGDDEGPQGRAQLHLSGGDQGREDGRRRRGQRRARRPTRPAPCGAWRARRSST